MNLTKLKAELIRDEGCAASVYQDSLGYWTIGVGHLVDRRKHGMISDAIIGALLLEDINKVTWALDKELPWWRHLTDDRQDALVNMAFNLGITGLLGFHHFLDSMEKGNMALAAEQMLQSLWATQVGERATRLSKVIRGEAT